MSSVIATTRFFSLHLFTILVKRDSYSERAHTISTILNGSRKEKVKEEDIGFLSHKYMECLKQRKEDKFGSSSK